MTKKTKLAEVIEEPAASEPAESSPANSLPPDSRRSKSRRHRQCRFGNGAPVPDRRQEFVLADHMIAVPDQVNKKVEDLGLDGYRVRSPS